MTIDTEKNLLELVEEFDTCMLVSQDTDALVSRPMSIADFNEETGVITFSTSLDTDKVEEINSNASVGVVFQSKTVYVSLSGKASINQDRERIRELFSDSWKLWYPEGPEQSDICLIVFTPARGEYWDYSGLQGLKSGWKAIRAFATGEPLTGFDKKVNAETEL